MQVNKLRNSLLTNKNIGVKPNPHQCDWLAILGLI